MEPSSIFFLRIIAMFEGKKFYLICMQKPRKGMN